MKKLSEHIVHFFQNQGFVIVSTIDKSGAPHNSCKGIVKISASGKVYMLDLYKERTFENLKRSSRIAITAVDEHGFRGFCLKGRARIVRDDKISPHIFRAWEQRIAQRITSRVLRNIGGQKGHPRHPEVVLPGPEYMIVMDVAEIINLTPHHIKQQVSQ